MKWISKINRGAILTGIIIFGVIVYLIVVFIVQSISIPGISDICTDYIAFDVKYSMLPEANRVEQPDMTEDEVGQYIEMMSNELKSFYPAGDQYSKYALNAKSASLQRQAAGIDVILEYTKEIISFRTFAFKDDTVTVTILTETYIDKAGTDPKDMSGSGKMETEDHIILMKSEGQWKVIHAEIMTPDVFYEDFPYYK